MIDRELGHHKQDGSKYLVQGRNGSFLIKPPPFDALGIAIFLRLLNRTIILGRNNCKVIKLSSSYCT